MRRDYTGLGELASEYQEHSGAVNVGTSLWIGFGYSFSPTGTANHSRLDFYSYPNGRSTYASYGTAGGLDDTLSRLSALTEIITLESYTYLGLGTVIKRAHPEPDIDLTYIKQSGESNGPQGDPYNGLDQFGRVADQRWRKGDGTHPDRFGYGYDRNSNRLYRENLAPGGSAFSELYSHPTQSSGYDDLDQVVGFKRGQLNGTKTDVTTSPLPRGQRWTLDLLGNWSQLVNITNGVSTTQTRTHNKQNQLTALNSTTLTYNAVGNLTQDEAGRALTYDAWNRLVTVGTLTYAYDALSRRVKETNSSPALTKDLYYSSSWQVLEERHDEAVKIQYVWSPVYVDALVLRDRDVNGLTGDGLEERLYVQQDANWNVTAVVSATGVVQERYTYDVYGLPTAHDPNTWAARSISFGWQNLHQGGRFEALVGLYHFRMREYSPTLGRWITLDPVGFAAGDSNLYRYLSNTPTVATDPFGLDALGGFSPGRQSTASDLDSIRPLPPRYANLEHGVYWGVRPVEGLSGLLLANHHFLLLIPEKPDDYPHLPMISVGGKKGIILSARGDERGKLEPMMNYTFDIKYLSPIVKENEGVQLRRIKPPLKSWSEADLVRDLLKQYEKEREWYKKGWARSYNKHTYNCTTWVSDRMSGVGMSSSDIISIGEGFAGSDWGVPRPIPRGFKEDPTRPPSLQLGR